MYTRHKICVIQWPSDWTSSKNLLHVNNLNFLSCSDNIRMSFDICVNHMCDGTNWKCKSFHLMFKKGFYILAYIKKVICPSFIN